MPEPTRTPWALDFLFDVTVDGRTLKLLNSIDEFTREGPAIVIDRSIDADASWPCSIGSPPSEARRGSSASTRSRVHRARRRGLVPVQ